MREPRKLRRHHLIGAVMVFIVGLVGTGSSATVGSASVATEASWVLDDILTWPDEVALPTWANATATATDGAINYETRHPALVQAGFDATWDPLPNSLASREARTITVGLTGYVIDEGDGGGAGGTPILLLGSGTVPDGPDDLPQILWTDSFNSVQCTGSGCSTTKPGSLSVTMPSTVGVDADERFWIGISMLNCGTACLVVYAYAPTESPADSPTCSGRRATLIETGPNGEMVGTPRADVIIGTNRADRIIGNGGADIICGRGGADVIDSGPGDDRVFGGRGNDTIRGGADGDTLDGGPGADDMDGGGQRDTLTGGSGNDDISGGPDRDAVNGGGGDDYIDGGGGPDNLVGGSGNDIIHGSGGSDDLDGGRGDDQCLAAPGANERVRNCELEGCGICGPNLVGEGGFESVSGGDREDGEGAPPPSAPWVVTDGRPAVQRYGIGDFPERLENLSGRNPNGGRNFLFGGQRRRAVVVQSFDVSSIEALIDDRLVTSRLVGWLGGSGADPDTVRVEAEFLKEDGSPIRTIRIGPVRSVHRGDQTGFLRRSRQVWIPDLTSQIRLVVKFVKVGPGVSDGYLDNLRLVLTDRPIRG